MNKLRIALCLLPILGWLAGCQPKPDATSEAQAEARPAAEAEAEAETVYLSPAEAAQAGVRVDTLQHRVLAGTLKVNGVLDVPPEQLISINAPLGGIVEQTRLLQGQRVRQGDVLAIIRNPAFISLQQQYLETQGRLAFAQADLERQSALVADEVAPEKNLQRARAEYAALSAQLESLKAQLKLAGLPAGRKPFATTATLRAPKDAFVKEVLVTTGQSVTATDPLFQLVDPSHLHVELTVFERDAARLRTGMPIRFTLPHDSGAEHHADIYLIGRSVDPAQRTLRVHGHLHHDEAHPGFMPGMFVRAVIETDQRRVAALPDAAIVTYEGADFVFAMGNASKGKTSYKLVPITRGLAEDGFTQVILEGQEATGSFVVRGAYALLGKLKNVGDD